MVLFSLSLPETQGDFNQILSVRNEINLTIFVFNSQSCPFWASSNLSVAVQRFFPVLSMVPRQFLLLSFWPTKELRPTFTCLSHLGGSNLLCVLSSLYSQKELSVFQFVELFIVIKMEWQLLSSLHAELEI